MTMTTPPRVGARIRVTSTHTSGARAIVEDVVAPPLPGDICDYRLAAGGPITLPDADGWTVTVEELEPPSLPAEPAPGSVARLTNARTTNMGRLYERYDEGWFEARDEGHEPKTWAELHAMGTVAPLVPATDLTELVELVRSALAEECERPAEWCVPWHNTARDLLAKHAGGAA